MSNFDSLIEQLSSLTVAESGQLVTDLEKLWGVKASGGQAAMPMLVGPTPTAKPAQTEFEVFLVSCGPQKIQVIKVLREALGLPLKESKDLADAAPRSVKDGLTAADAEALKAKIEAVGGVVEIK